METTRTVLVATSRYLLKVDLETAAVEALDQGRGLYYGITWDESHYYVAARRYPPFLPSSKIERPCVLVFDAGLKRVGILKIDVRSRGLHQILFHGGLLYCSCSRDDSYAILDGGRWSLWYPSGDSAHHGRDVHHFNSVWIERERMYLLGHNNGPSDVWELTYPERELLGKFRVGQAAHNVWREDGVLAVCNSRRGTIETVDGRTLCTTGGFPRGVAIAPDRNVVGISAVADRSNRSKTSGRIQVYSKAWELEKEIGLGQCGQVTEIRSLTEDLGHNGLPPPR